VVRMAWMVSTVPAGAGHSLKRKAAAEPGGSRRESKGGWAAFGEEQEAVPAEIDETGRSDFGRGGCGSRRGGDRSVQRDGGCGKFRGQSTGGPVAGDGGWGDARGRWRRVSGKGEKGKQFFLTPRRAAGNYESCRKK